MKRKAIQLKTDTTTEEKIKNAARFVFHKKGFSSTRTRDIAEQAGINLALLNYYFRSKQKLFDIIMLESLQEFFRSLKEVYNDNTTSLEAKIDMLVNSYIELLTANPEIPLFILNELKLKPETFVSKIGMKDSVVQSHFMKQFQRLAAEGKIAPLNPLHFLLNLMSLIVFPFVASPILMAITELSKKDLDNLMQQRRELIPKWIKATLKAK